MSALTIEDFKNLSGYADGEFNAYYINHLLSVFDGLVNERLGMPFELVTIGESQIKEYVDFRGCNTGFRKIGAWQTDSLIIKKGAYCSTSDLTTLVENEDFIFEYPNELNHPLINPPVYAIQMLGDSIITDGQFLRITGLLGWSNSYPKALVQTVYAVLKELEPYNRGQTDSDGKGVLKKLKTLGLEEEYALSKDHIRESKNMALNILSNPQVDMMLNYYKGYISSFQTKLV